jgi:hypothetical protein
MKCSHKNKVYRERKNIGFKETFVRGPFSNIKLPMVVEVWKPSTIQTICADCGKIIKEVKIK